MKKALIIHGWDGKKGFYDPNQPTNSNANWFPWLSKQLMIRDIHTVAIEMPNSYYPEYEIWKKELERFELDKDTILIGHSCGASFIVRYLSENNVKVGKVFLVAPWLGLPFDDDEPFDETFFQFDIDKNLTKKTAGVLLIESTDDMPQIQESAKILKDKIVNMDVLTFSDKGHFDILTANMHEFPELLEEIIR